MTDLLSELPALIRAELARRHMTQRDLADDIDTHASTITRLLQRKGMCDVPTFVRLATWLRIPPEEFADEQVARAYQRGQQDVMVRVDAAMRGDGDD